MAKSKTAQNTHKSSLLSVELCRLFFFFFSFAMLGIFPNLIVSMMSLFTTTGSMPLLVEF